MFSVIQTVLEDLFNEFPPLNRNAYDFFSLLKSGRLPAIRNLPALPLHCGLRMRIHAPMQRFTNLRADTPSRPPGCPRSDGERTSFVTQLFAFFTSLPGLSVAEMVIIGLPVGIILHS